MGRIKIIRKGDGTAFKDKSNRYVFVKEGVHFALSEQQMSQMVELINGLNSGALLQIDPASDDMAKGD